MNTDNLDYNVRIWTLSNRTGKPHLFLDREHGWLWAAASCGSGSKLDKKIYTWLNEMDWKRQEKAR